MRAGECLFRGKSGRAAEITAMAEIDNSLRCNAVTGVVSFRPRLARF